MFYPLYAVRYTLYERQATKLPSTSVERPLQISSFMQNKANFPDEQMNVTKVSSMDYKNKTLGGCGKNKANSKPNKANLLKAKMNVNKVLSKEYENIANCALAENKPNTNPIQSQTNPILTPAQVNIIRCDLRLSQSENLSIIIEKVELLLQNNGVPESKGRF